MIKYNRDENATNYVGCALKDELRNEEVRRRRKVTTSVVTIVERKRNKFSWYGDLY